MTLSSYFLSNLVIRAYQAHELERGERQQYLLVEDLVYHSAILGTITVPKGTVTDFASIPGCALWYVDDDSPCILYGSVVHDWLYSLGGKLPDGRRFKREVADQVLREIMLVCGARRAQAAVVFKAVSWFGGSHWVSAPVTPITLKPS